jgi:hypothetical protein
VYYDKDGSGRAILLNSVSVASALEAILQGTANPKQSRSMLERSVHVRRVCVLCTSLLTNPSRRLSCGQALNATLVQLGEAVAAHPYMTILAILGLVGAVVMALRSVLMDESAEWTADKRFVKGDRLD